VWLIAFLVHSAVKNAMMDWLRMNVERLDRVWLGVTEGGTA
jgi:methylglyoxal synthase